MVKVFNIIHSAMQKIKLRSRLILAFSFLTMTSSIVVGAVSYYVLNSLAQEKVSGSVMSILESSMLSLDNRLIAIDDVYRNIINNRDIVEMLENPEPSPSEISIYKTDFRDFIYPSIFGFRTQYIDYVYIFGSNNLHLLSSQTVFFKENDFSNLQSLQYVQKAEEMRGKMLWLLLDEDIFNKMESFTGDTTPHIIGIRKLFSYNSIVSKEMEEWGYMVIKLRKDYIEEVYQETYKRVGSPTYILDSDRKMFLYENNELSLDDTAQLETARNGTGIHSVSLANKKYFAHVFTSDYTGWSFVALVPSGFLGEGVNELWGLIEIAVLAMIAISVIIAIFMSLSITTPVKEILRKMNDVRKGNFDVSIDVCRNDEIGLLADNFNRMVLDIRELLARVKNDEKEIRRQELKALQAQINPHFLYNTLDSIYWIAMNEKSSMIPKIAIALSDYFRLSLNKGRDVTTISKEIDHVRNYLIIQKMRFEDKFDYEIKELDNSSEYECIPLILQPLVENSLLHGLKHMKTGGIISVKAKEEDDFILIEVEDNGCSFDAYAMREMIYDSSPKMSRSYGLRNVNDRIRLKYGDEYGLFFKNGSPKGAVVGVKLPKRQVSINPAK